MENVSEVEYFINILKTLIYYYTICRNCTLIVESLHIRAEVIRVEVIYVCGNLLDKQTVL